MLKKLAIWRRQEEGVVAVEFALLALPFFMIIMGMIEISLFFAAGAVLEGGSAAAARMIRTGAVQASEDPEATFSEELCDQTSMIIDCDDLEYEVIRVEPNTFSGAEEYEPTFDAEGNLVAEPFATGNSNDVVLVRAIYRYEFITPYIGAMMTGDPNQTWLRHMSTVIIKAEPYNFGEE